MWHCLVRVLSSFCTCRNTSLWFIRSSFCTSSAMGCPLACCAVVAMSASIMRAAESLELLNCQVDSHLAHAGVIVACLHTGLQALGGPGMSRQSEIYFLQCNISVRAPQARRLEPAPEAHWEPQGTPDHSNRAKFIKRASRTRTRFNRAPYLLLTHLGGQIY